MEPEKKLLFDHLAIHRAIEKIVDAIVKEFRENQLREVALIGIQVRGVILAQRLRDAIIRRTGIELPAASLDITMYRDDIGKRNTLPVIRETDIPFELDDKAVVLVDDVLHTGRTIRAALDALTYYGRPALIRLAALVDRGRREFPIQADYAGLTAELPPHRKMRIEFGDTPESDVIYEINRKQ